MQHLLNEVAKNPILMIWNQLKLHQVFPFLPRFSTRFLKENAQGRREIFRNGQPRGPQRGPDDDIPGGPREIRVGICVYVFANKMMIQKNYSHYFI